MSVGCRRWAECADRRAEDGTLSPAEATAVGSHETACPACAAEAALWRTLPAVEAPTGLSHDRRRALVEAALARCQREDPDSDASVVRYRPRWLPRKSIWAVAAGTLAAAVAIGVVSLRHAHRQPAATVAAVPAVRLVLAAGVVAVDERTAAIGDPLAEAAVLRVEEGALAGLAIDGGIGVVLTAGTELRIAELSPTERRLELRRGKLVASLSAQREGTAFSVETATARLTAVGTAFAVTAPAGSDRGEAGVLEGSVLLRLDEREQPIVAHQAAALFPPLSLRWRAPAEEAEDARLAGLAARWRTDRVAVLEITSDPPGAAVAIDGQAYAATPLSVAATPGLHAIEILGEGGEPVRDRLALVPGQILRRAYRLGPAPVAAVAALEPAADGSVRRAHASPAALLLRARHSRQSGDALGAAAAYRSLIARYPRTAEARAARVSLGLLELDRLGDPFAALRSLDAYLATGDRTLEPGARYGRVRALRALGDREAEARAADELLRLHPDSVEAAVLRQRRRPVEGPAGP